VRTARRLLWVAGTPVRWALLVLIRTYELTLSAWFGGQCRFFPSCSQYAQEAIRVHGAFRGSALAAWRLLRCGPFTRGGFDPVPAPRPRHPTYEAVIPNVHASRASGVDP